jgi:hypothetical protein
MASRLSDKLDGNGSKAGTNTLWVKRRYQQGSVVMSPYNADAPPHGIISDPGN